MMIPKRAIKGKSYAPMMADTDMDMEAMGGGMPALPAPKGRPMPPPTRPGPPIQRKPVAAPKKAVKKSRGRG
jgi:hypothetical protein